MHIGVTLGEDPVDSAGLFGARSGTFIHIASLEDRSGRKGWSEVGTGCRVNP